MKTFSSAPRGNSLRIKESIAIDNKKSVLGGADAAGLQALITAHDLIFDALSFDQRLEALRHNGGEMHEHILATAFGRDETKAFGIIEPFHGSILLLAFVAQIFHSLPLRGLLYSLTAFFCASRRRANFAQASRRWQEQMGS
jgi:hypothetical protein